MVNGHARCQQPFSLPIAMTFVYYSLIFGIISIALGVIGFVRAKSRASLIAGGISGLLLLCGWYLMSHGQVAGKWLSAAVCLLLLGRFLPVFLKSKQVYPAGIMAILALIGCVLGVQAFL
jgi:uncharacterized membrane protein (UPF0136 family)